MRISDWSSDVCSSDLIDARFLLQFPGDGLLDRFADFDEAGERRIAIRREAVLTAEQRPPVVDRKHDDDRVGAGEMLDLARIAVPRPAAANRTDERRVATECVSTCRSRRSPDP